MSNINKQALREAAIEAKSTNDWGCDAENFHDKATPNVVLALLDELEAAELERENWRVSFENERIRADKLAAELEAREVTLPRPACTYADHSYPAYSRRQVVSLLETLGIRINGEG